MAYSSDLTVSHVIDEGWYRRPHMFREEITIEGRLLRDTPIPTQESVSSEAKIVG